jgi:hypothetical protein
MFSCLALVFVSGQMSSGFVVDQSAKNPRNGTLSGRIGPSVHLPRGRALHHTPQEKYTDCMDNLSDGLSEYPSRVGVCCGRNPEALDCLGMYMECKAYFNGKLEEQYEVIGEFPSDWNVSGIRCYNYCNHLDSKPSWCTFPK